MKDNLTNDLNIKLYIDIYIYMGIDRIDKDYITYELYEYIETENNLYLIDNKLRNLGEKVHKMRLNLYEKLQEISDEEYLEFMKKTFEYIYKREYGRGNLYEAFINEHEDNYYWILGNMFGSRFWPYERKYHKELYEFYLEKSEETLKYINKKHKQAMKYDPDSIGAQENIDSIENYIKRLKLGEFNKF